MPSRKQEIGRKIREARAAKGWKQKQLAAQVDVEPITVSRWERGATTPDLDVLRLVGDATGKPLSYFVDDPAREGEAAPVDDAARRLEAAAARIAETADRIADLLGEIRTELASRR